MEHNHHSEQPPQESELSLDNLHELHEQLGFIETEELQTIRAYAIEASSEKDDESVKVLIREYQLYSEEAVNELEDVAYVQAQIGLIMATAALHKETGNRKAFLNDTADALNYAYNMYEDYIVEVLEKVPSTEIARILAEYGDDYGFDEQTLVEIANQPYRDTLEVAHEYLMQAGLDADEILRDFMDDHEAFNEHVTETMKFINP